MNRSPTRKTQKDLQAFIIVMHVLLFLAGIAGSFFAFANAFSGESYPVMIALIAGAVFVIFGIVIGYFCRGFRIDLLISAAAGSAGLLLLFQAYPQALIALLIGSAAVSAGQAMGLALGRRKAGMERN